ncbi:gdp-mannose pyrophosphorylase [Arabis alpina]|uniref:Gdp-mannose pyrophosphorylase n=1 Tax=Arabis alpina TaxID=50452 RepID=A0A087GTH6_ARAAL|nr:gdp-mannose pyrophosphorylase [Arabis alpina]
MSEEKVVAVIMVGGPTKGTRFRPLSFNTPKPLIPLAGQPMIHHPISACKKISNLAQIFLIGFYEEREFALYVSSISNELKIPVRYLKEDKPHGSAGALYYFRDRIMEEKPVSAEAASQFGELIADPDTKELLHYTEKPETFVISCLVVSDFLSLVLDFVELIRFHFYPLDADIFKAIEGVYSQMRDTSSNYQLSSFGQFQSATRSVPADFVRLDQDILSPLAGKKQLYTYENKDFWEQIKTPGKSLKCSALYLAQFRETSPHLLASGDGTNKKPMIVGDVYIHPSVKLHPTAKIGPNVSISANVRVGPGVRLINCIILDDVEIKENAVVINSIIGWKSSIGKWSRVQASGEDNERLGITILGEAVTVEDEVAVIGSIVLQNKTLNVSVQEDIIL